jgi:hypothetical protein
VEVWDDPNGGYTVTVLNARKLVTLDTSRFSTLAEARSFAERVMRPHKTVAREYAEQYGEEARQCIQSREWGAASMAYLNARRAARAALDADPELRLVERREPECMDPDDDAACECGHALTLHAAEEPHRCVALEVVLLAECECSTFEAADA